MESKILEEYIQLMEDLRTAGRSVENKITENDVCPKQLAVGILVEYEHTDIEYEAKKIALDHLAEHKDYYTKLVKAGLVDEKPALDKYRELFK